MVLIMSKKIVLGIVIVFLVALAGITLSGPDASDEAIVLGAVLSLSGSAAFDGESIKNGIDLAVFDLHNQGVAVDVIYEDDETNPKATVNAVQKLTSFDKPKAIIGPTWSFLGDAAAEALASHNLISYQPANTSEFVDVGRSTVFFGAVKNANKEKALADFFKDQDYKRVAIIIDGTAWGQSNIAPVTEAIRQNGGEVVYVEKIEGDDSTVVSTSLTKIKHANADVIFWTGFLDAGSLILRKSHDLNLGIPIIGEQLLGLGDNYEIAKDLDSGVYTINISDNNAFIEKYRSHYGQDPNDYADSAYDGLMILVEAIQNTDGSTEAIADYLRNDLKYEGYAGTYEFDENGDIEGGEWIIRKVE